MRLVLDASVAIKLVVDEPGTAAALALLDRDARRLAPDWMLIEAANALWNKVRYSQTSEMHAVDSLAALPRFLDEIIPAVDLLDRAVSLSFRLRHAVYDCLYLALALQTDAVVVTADHKLAAAAERGELGSRVEMMTWAR